MSEILLGYMTSLTNPRAHASTVSAGGSGLPRIASLDPFVYRDMRWCARCGGEQLFVPCFEVEAGRVGVCMGCGEEKLVAWTRTNAEAC